MILTSPPGAHPAAAAAAAVAAADAQQGDDALYQHAWQMLRQQEADRQAGLQQQPVGGAASNLPPGAAAQTPAAARPAPGAQIERTPGSAGPSAAPLGASMAKPGPGQRPSSPGLPGRLDAGKAPADGRQQQGKQQPPASAARPSPFATLGEAPAAGDSAELPAPQRPDAVRSGAPDQGGAQPLAAAAVPAAAPGMQAGADSQLLPAEPVLLRWQLRPRPEGAMGPSRLDLVFALHGAVFAGTATETGPLPGPLPAPLQPPRVDAPTPKVSHSSRAAAARHPALPARRALGGPWSTHPACDGNSQLAPGFVGCTDCGAPALSPPPPKIHPGTPCPRRLRTRQPRHRPPPSRQLPPPPQQRRLPPPLPCCTPPAAAAWTTTAACATGAPSPAWPSRWPPASCPPTCWAACCP